MIVTEKEAATKRCQESFGDRRTTKDGRIDLQHVQFGPDAVMTSPSYCIGSACMAWEWAEMERDPLHGGEFPTRGYCGKVRR